MKVGKRLLLTVIALGSLSAIILLIGYYWDIIAARLPSEAVWNKLLPIAGPIMGGIVLGILYFISRQFLKPWLIGGGINAKVENCGHSIGYTLERNDLAGTRINVSFRIENKGEETQLTGVKLECKSKGYTYKTEEKPRKNVILHHNRLKQYSHRFFINGHEIQEDKLKCIFRLCYVGGEKKISYTSTRRAV